jgi:hypothetical protein
MSGVKKQTRSARAIEKCQQVRACWKEDETQKKRDVLWLRQMKRRKKRKECG